MKASLSLTALLAVGVTAIPFHGGQEGHLPVQIAPGPSFPEIETSVPFDFPFTQISGESHKPVGWADPSSVVPTKFLPRTASDGIEHFATIKTSSVTAVVSVKTTSTKSGTAQILPSLTTAIPQTTGSVITTLATDGKPSGIPSTKIPSPTSLLSVSTSSNKIKQSSVVPVMSPSENIFQPIATDAPPSVIGSRSDHPVPRLGIKPQDSPIGTNKFYQNFFLGSQSAGTWTHPYSVAWAKGGGSSKSWGMSIQHIDANQRVFGPDASANPVQYFINPIGIQSVVLSAAELGSSTALSMDSVTAFSANIKLSPTSGGAPAISFPLVQGMGFVTGKFTGATPILQTGVFFRSVTRTNISPKPGVTKYSILLEDGKTWLLYAYSYNGATLQFTVVNNGLVQATSGFNGIIQIAKSTGSVSEALYDSACGTYPTTTTISGSAHGAAGSYTLSFSTGGMPNTQLLMFALPHHVKSFDSATSAGVKAFSLDTTTKGKATAVLGNSWTMLETLPINMGFGPYNSAPGNSKIAFSQAAKSAMQVVAQSEVSQDMDAQSNLNSMYYSGKALAKFAQLIYTMYEMIDQTALAQAGLVKLKKAFAVFAENRQQYPLVHETAWGGIVSSASYITGNQGDDFGNTYYNDHHFHYGYFVLAGAIIGYLDPTWLPANAPYINALVRDFANPSPQDPYFPVSRNMDWYHGHSWAHGLYESYDGRDQESSSEDAMSSYAIKMWGLASSNPNLEALGNLQLAVTARALQSYYLYENSNTVQPANFIGNKVAGILFENKIDHTTYFGGNIEYVQGIHMLPLLPCSSFTRTKTFVQEEWDRFFSNGRVDSVAGGWRGVLYANLALIDPIRAWNYFSSANFDAGTLDGGASRTWYMALAAGLGGAQ